MAPKAAKPKPKAKKDEEEEQGPSVQAPDREEFDAKLAKIQEEIEGFQAQQGTYATKIAERSGGKEEYYAKRAEYKAQLDAFSEKINSLVERKESVNKAMGDKRQEASDLKNQLNKMKKSMGYQSEQEIDDRIAFIEFKLQTESMPLREEKEYLKEIQDLKKSRPKVGQVHKMEDNLANRDTGSDLRENITDIKEELGQYRDGKRAVSEKLAKLNEERKDQLGDLPKYIEERDAIGKKIREKMDERNTIRDEFRAKEREFNQWRNEQRKARQDKYQEERDAQRADIEKKRRARKAEELETQPHMAEITLIEQCTLYCQSLIADKGPAKVEEKKETNHGNIDGVEVLMKKEDREEFYYAPTAKKKSKSKNKGAKETGGARPIKHNAETFKLFDQLKLNAPITTDDIPAIIVKLEELLADYKHKVSEWEKNKEERKAKIMAGEEDEAPPAAAEEAPPAAAEEEDAKADEEGKEE